jgi:hypothetical protein
VRAMIERTVLVLAVAYDFPVFVSVDVALQVASMLIVAYVAAVAAAAAA